MANSVDPDQMPHSAAFNLDLHCLQKLICPNTGLLWGYYGVCMYIYMYIYIYIYIYIYAANFQNI